MGKMALANLENTDAVLKEKFVSALQQSEIKGFIPLRSVSQYEPLNKTLLKSLSIALLDIKCNKNEFTSLKKEVISLMVKTIIQTSDIIEVLEQTAHITGKKLLIVIDEFGYLEIEKKGYYNSVKKVLNGDKDVIIVVREDLLKNFIEEFKGEYFVLNT